MNETRKQIEHDVVREALAGFDGKATTIPAEANARFGNTPGFIVLLIDLLNDHEEMVGSAASWILLDRQKAGKLLSPEASVRLLEVLVKTKEINLHWSTQLHVCQMVGLLPLGALENAHVQKLVEWLQPYLSHDRPFIRAWALDAIVALSRVHSKFHPLAAAALKAAQSDAAASVRARARKLG